MNDAAQPRPLSIYLVAGEESGVGRLLRHAAGREARRSGHQAAAGDGAAQAEIGRRPDERARRSLGLRGYEPLETPKSQTSR